MLLFVSCVFDCDTIPDTPDKLRALDVLCTSSFACRALNAHTHVWIKTRISPGY